MKGVGRKCCCEWREHLGVAELVPNLFVMEAFALRRGHRFRDLGRCSTAVYAKSVLSWNKNSLDSRLVSLRLSKIVSQSKQEETQKGYSTVYPWCNLVITASVIMVKWAREIRTQTLQTKGVANVFGDCSVHWATATNSCKVECYIIWAKYLWTSI